MSGAVEYGLPLPTGGECGDPRFLVELAELAESAGWDGLFLEDYVCYQGDPSAPTCNTWVALAAIAVRTERIRLGTEVTPLTRRRPWNVAREAAGVDQLSGGRMILGVGLGHTGESLTDDASFLRSARSATSERAPSCSTRASRSSPGSGAGSPSASKANTSGSRR